MTALSLIILSQEEHAQTLALRFWEYGTTPETLVNTTCATEKNDPWK